MAGHHTTVALHSIGCRTNQQELASLQRALQARGYHVTTERDAADIVVVNTCCVTNTAQGKSRRAVRAVARDAPNARILVCGCLAQLTPDAWDSVPQVTWVVGNARKDDIPGILEQPGGVYHGPPEARPHAGTTASARQDAGTHHYRTRFALKIQEGCNCRCSYCIVPVVRGPARSVPASEVFATARSAVAGGARELVLTGTHIGQYHHEQYTLERLLRELSDMQGEYRIRLSSLDPRDITEPLLDMVAHNPRVCRYLHVSVQSLAPSVLAGMGRPAAVVDSVAERLARLRSDVPDIALGGDFIVGFPGESDADFRTTCMRLAETGFTTGHVFRFSPRPGTAAATMQSQLDAGTKSARSHALQDTLHERHRQFCMSLAGTVQRIVVERDDPAQGLTSQNLRVRVPGADCRPNQWLDVRLDTHLQHSRFDFEGTAVRHKTGA